MQSAQHSDTTYQQLKALCERRSSRRAFLDLPVSDEAISKILAIAATSPYASGKQNWEITVLRDQDTLKRMAAAVQSRSTSIAGQVDPEYVDGFRQYASNFLFFEHAPAVLVLSFRTQKSLSLMLRGDAEQNAAAPALSPAASAPRVRDELAMWERDSYVKSISCVAMLVLLAAESLGLGACYMTGPLIAEKEITALLHLKKGRSIGAIIPLGYYETPDSSENQTDSEQQGSAT